MNKRIFVALLLFSSLTSKAQLGAMKLVGKDTRDYKLGLGAFIKTGFPVGDGSDITIEGGLNIFFLDSYGNSDGTIMCPLKIGYRYTLNQTGQGFYVEPQGGYNMYGVTSLHDENGIAINLKYHGVVLAAGTGYLFNIGDQPFDLNLRYETVIAHGGSNNFIALGISRFIGFRKRDND